MSRALKLWLIRRVYVFWKGVGCLLIETRASHVLLILSVHLTAWDFSHWYWGNKESIREVCRFLSNLFGIPNWDAPEHSKWLWHQCWYHQRVILTFLRATAIISDLQVTESLLKCFISRIKWKTLHFCPCWVGFFWVSLGEWVLPAFWAGLHQFCVGMSTAVPLWLHR